MSINKQQQRAFWLRHLHNWHWISSAICLIAMMLFAVTGFTLNHASSIEAKAKVSQVKANLPASMLASLSRLALNEDAPASGLPANVQQWIEQEQHIQLGKHLAEWSEEEVYIALPRPGGDAWLRIDLETGQLEYELTERGMIAFLNDLHKGRNTGKAWSWFIDIFAFACLIFCITGLFLLKMHAKNRMLTWPLVTLGFVIPLLLMVLFIH